MVTKWACQSTNIEIPGKYPMDHIDYTFNNSKLASLKVELGQAQLQHGPDMARLWS